MNLRQLKKEIEALKIKTEEETGSYKYDFAYDEVLDLIEKYETRD